MKFYVTGRSSNISEVQNTIAFIISRGHEVTFNWPQFPMIKPYEENPGKTGDFALTSIQGVIDADVHILLADHDGTGVFAELGAALALTQLHGKPKIYAVAREIPPAMFHYHPAIKWVFSIEDVFFELGC